MARRHVMTARRRAALRKAQLASAAKRHRTRSIQKATGRSKKQNIVRLAGASVILGTYAGASVYGNYVLINKAYYGSNIRTIRRNKTAYKHLNKIGHSRRGAYRGYERRPPGYHYSFDRTAAGQLALTGKKVRK